MKDPSSFVVVVVVVVFGAVARRVSTLTTAKAGIVASAPFTFIRGQAGRVAIVVVAVVVVVVAIVVVVVIVVAAHILFPSVETFVHVVEGDCEMIDLHGGRLGGGGRGNEGGNEGGRADSGGVGFERVYTIHFGSILKKLRESDIRVLENVSFNQLLQSQWAVVNEGGLGKFVDCDLGRVIGGIAKKGTQEVLECGQEGGEIGGHAKVGEGAAAGTCEVVRDILLLESRSEFCLEVASVGEAASIEPTSRARRVQVGQGVGGAFTGLNLGKGEVTVDGEKPSQGGKTVAFACKDRGRIKAGWGDHDRQRGKERR